MRMSVGARIDKSITQESSINSDRKLLKEFCCIVDYRPDDFKYLKEKIERKYDFLFMKYHARLDLLKQWKNIKDTLSSKKISQPKVKDKKAKIINEAAYAKPYGGEFSPTQALERFYKLKAEEKKQKLLEEVRNVDLLW